MPISPLKHLVAAGMLVLAAVGVVPLAHGQVSADDRAAAREAANNGRKVFDDGDYPEAIDQFELANQFVRAPTHLLYLARANAHLGRLIAARDLYIEVDSEQLEDTAPAPFLQAQQDARRELRALDRRIPRISIELTGDADDRVKVTMDGYPVPANEVGAAQRVDPGEHTFRAHSPTSHARPVTIAVDEGEEKTVRLVLESEADLDQPDEEIEEPTPVSDGGSRNLTPYIGYGSIGVGVVAVGVGAFFISKAGKRTNDADALFDACTHRPNNCTDAEKDQIGSLDKDAASARTGAVVSFVAGGVLVAGGITLLVLAPNIGGSKTAATTWHPWVGLGSAGISGTF